MPTDPTLELLRNLVRALDDKKAEALRVLKVGTISTITDYLVVATGNSDPHLRALRIETEKIFDAAKWPIAGLDAGGYGAGWTVFDGYQVMVHLFTAEQRENYALENLWKDAEEVAVADLLAAPKKAAAAKAAGGVKARKAPVKKSAGTKMPVKKTAAKKKTTAKRKKSD